jgi:signal transduction histidine kinase
MSEIEENSSRQKPTFEEQLEQQRKSRLLHVMAMAGALVCALFLLLMLILGGDWPAYYLIFAFQFLCCVLSVLLNRRRRLVFASYLYLVSLSLSIVGMVLAGIFYGHLIGFGVYFLPLTVLAAGMLLGSRITYRFATWNVGLIVFFSVVARAVLPLDSEQYITQELGVVIPAGVLCYLMALVAWLYGSRLEGTLHQLAEQSQQLETANQEIRTFSATLQDKVEQRTRELQELVLMVAHDLRNPLTVIRGYAEMLKDGQAPASQERQMRALRAITANVDHMLSLTDDLLAISCLQSGTVAFDMEAMPIEALIEQVSTSFQPRFAEKGLKLKLEIAPDLPQIWGDSLHLTRVLNNLVGNAYYYTPSGGIIVGAHRVNGVVEVCVSDTGIGIPPEEQAHVFTHFFRGEHPVVRSRKGAGLGLPIAHSIVEAHGGQIEVESKVGRGTTIRFTLPLAPDPLPDGTWIGSEVDRGTTIRFTLPAAPVLPPDGTGREASQTLKNPAPCRRCEPFASAQRCA